MMWEDLAAELAKSKSKTNQVFPAVSQYPLAWEAEDGIYPVVLSLKGQGVLIPARSPCNTDISPVKKEGKFDEQGRQIWGLPKICEKSMLLLSWVTQLFLTLQLFQPPSLQKLLTLLLLTYVLLLSLSTYTSVHSFCLPLFTSDNSTPGQDFLKGTVSPLLISLSA